MKRNEYNQQLAKAYKELHLVRRNTYSEDAPFLTSMDETLHYILEELLKQNIGYGETITKFYNYVEDVSVASVDYIVVHRGLGKCYLYTQYYNHLGTYYDGLDVHLNLPANSKYFYIRGWQITLEKT